MPDSWKSDAADHESRGIFPTWLVAIFALATALPMIFFASNFREGFGRISMRCSQRVVLEGLSFAMVVFVPLAGLYVNARAAGLLSLKLDPTRANADTLDFGRFWNPGFVESIEVKNCLAELREEKGWSQGDLAEKLGVSRQTINALERGKYDPSFLGIQNCEAF